MLFGCLVLLGWIFDITALKTFLLGAFSVKANAAVGFLLAGVSLRLALIDPTDRRIQSLKQACAVVVALIGLLTLSQYLFGWNLGIDQLLFKEPVGAFGTFSPGRMGPNTALNFLLVGIGLLLMDRETRQGRHPAQYLIISACVIAVLAVVGHFYGAKVLFGILDYTLMPVQTGAAFTVLCLSMLFAQSEIGLMAIINNSGNAGLLTLRMLPIALIVPVVLGWIGLMGERAGLYDTTFGISLMAVTYTIVLVIGILVTARSLNQTDATRREIENGLENTRKELEIIKITADEVSEFAESVINTVREPLISLDQDLRVVKVSRSFYEFFKVNPEETVGQLIYDLGNKQWDIPKLRELLETILPEKASFDNYEVEHDFATIGRRTMLLNARQIQRMQGKERIILLAIEDITERREVENFLENTRKELEIIKITADEVSEFAESVINTVREPLISLDQDLRVVKVSRSFYEFFKVNPEETVGQLIYDLGNKQWDIPKLRELLETILPEKASFDNYEVEHDFATIGRRTMLLNARQIQRMQGKERIILLAIEDITERRDIENGLENTRKELEIIKITADEVSEFAESVINTVREPLISLDQDLRVVKVSRSFYEFFKVNPEETVGQLIYDLGNKQWDIPKLRELLETILPEKASFDNYEVEHDFATIGRRTMLLNARQIQRMQGKERIILLAIEDITERREVEIGLEKTHEELNELATELNRASRAKSEFLANMSHELRTPLNSIIGFSEVLYDETFGSINEKQRKYVNNVLTSGKHLLLLINQILDTAKVESGMMKLALSSLPMKDLLNEISMLVTDLVSKKKLQLLLEIDEDLPSIEGDELKVKEIIYNLLSNAVKFTPEGGTIGLRAKNTGSGVEIVVWDTGIGIAAENIEKVFEGFFRVDTPYSRLTEGTGLGLPLSRKLAELHGGKLSVESEGLNKGTLVRLTLPLLSRKEG